jgi:hypothetical protein
MALASVRGATLLSLALACTAPLAQAGRTSHFTCVVTGVRQLEHLGRDGQSAELSQFTCSVRGGLLDGFVAAGTNIWEPGKNSAVLIGSIVVARKADAAVVYEVLQATRKRVPPDGRAGSWEGGGRGLYKLATGTAAPLAGKSFRSVAHNDGPRAFTIDATVIE